MKPGITNNIQTQSSDPQSWVPNFPNPADFRFDYFKLLSESPNGLAILPEGNAPSVAIIGAGVAGMTTARELLRCGYNVTIFEASSRIGGRLYTEKNPLDSNPDGSANLDHAGMEMGAMRMPFFSESEEHIDSHNSILGYYLNYEAGENSAMLTAFPNPGAAPGNTGIYINKGYGPQGAQYLTPTLIPWPENGSPDNEVLQVLNDQASTFESNFQIAATTYYIEDNDKWTICWSKMVAFYENMTFNDMVLAPAMTEAEIISKIGDLDTFDGNLGGFGMSSEQANLLYTIGTGDGSWGAFYSIGALWFLRCTYFGFDSYLQTVEGLSDPSSLPYFNSPVQDSSTPPNDLVPPIYEGIQSLVEYLFYVPTPSLGKSLYTDASLYVNCPVTKIQKDLTGGVVVFSPQYPEGEVFDNVVVSATQWAAQLSMEFDGFSQTELPTAKITIAHTQHNISSCKLFFPLKERYWENGVSNIPQIIVTDTLVQDLYGLAWESKPDDPGVLLASYTWEDDSLKLLPYSEVELSAIVLAKLKEITMTTLGEDITQYIEETLPVTIQWIKEPTYIGCSKLYRAHNEADNMLDLAYNQSYSSASNLYFAGENYGVEGGWTEPALRSAMDCVIQMVKNTSGATFNNSEFYVDTDYPKWPATVFADVKWQDTGINIPENTTTTITYISGEWTADPSDNGGELYGAAGTPSNIPGKPGYALEGANEGALVGRIDGGEPFLISTGVTVPEGLFGNLELCINDDLEGDYGAGFADNQGNLLVQVIINS